MRAKAAAGGRPRLARPASVDEDDDDDDLQLALALSASEAARSLLPSPLCVLNSYRAAL